MRNSHLTDKISVVLAANGCVGCSVPRLWLTGPAGGLADALVMFPTVGHTVSLPPSTKAANILVFTATLSSWSFEGESKGA